MKLSNNEKSLIEGEGSNRNAEGGKHSNAVKDPDDWTTGNEPMTGAQHSYLTTLSAEAGEEFDETLSKRDASKKIDELQHKTGRGQEDERDR